MREAVDQIIEIDSQMTILKRVSGGQEDINRMMEESIRLADQLGTKMIEVNEAIVGFARQGYRGDDLIAISEVATLMGNVSTLSLEESMSKLTAAMKVFNISAEDSIRIVDALNEVDKLLSHILAIIYEKPRICWKTVIQPLLVGNVGNYIII